MHIIFLSRASSSLLTSGACAFKILFGGRESRYSDTICVCMIFVFCIMLSGVVSIWFDVMLVVKDSLFHLSRWWDVL